MNKDEYNYIFKLIIIGDSNVGKSCYLNYFLKNKCNFLKLDKSDLPHTLSVEFGSKIMIIDNIKVKL